MKNVALPVAAALIVFSATRADAACDYSNPDPNFSWTTAWTSPNGLRTYSMEAPCYVEPGWDITYTARVDLDPSCPTTTLWIASNWSIVDEAGEYDDPPNLAGWTPSSVTTLAAGFAIEVTDREWVQAITTSYGSPLWHQIRFTFTDLNGTAAGQCYPSGMFWNRNVQTIGVTADPWPPLSISPRDPGVAAGGNLTFVATGGPGDGRIWSLATNASGGSIDAATGVYTAGPTSGVTDVVHVIDSAEYVATTSVTVTAAAVSISPATATVQPRESVTFTAQGGSGTGFVWSLATNGSGGSIDASGRYTAGHTFDVTDVVQVTDSLGNTSTATVAVERPGLGGCGTTRGGASAMMLGLAAVLYARRRRTTPVRQ